MKQKPWNVFSLKQKPLHVFFSQTLKQRAPVFIFVSICVFVFSERQLIWSWNVYHKCYTKYIIMNLCRKKVWLQMVLSVCCLCLYFVSYDVFVCYTEWWFQLYICLCERHHQSHLYRRWRPEGQIIHCRCRSVFDGNPPAQEYKMNQIARKWQDQGRLF